MFALYSSNTWLIASITWRGFWLVAALSRYATGLLPCTFCESTGKSARMRATSSGALAARVVTAMSRSLASGLACVQLFAHEVVALGLELGGELASASPHDAPINEHVHEIRRDIAEHPLVVRDQKDPDLRRAQRLDPL